MKHTLGILFILFSSCLYGQDFEFHGKSKNAIITHYNLGDNEPYARQEESKRLNIAFNGRELSIGKELYKYIWHQNSKDMEIVQLNCIERDEAGAFPYKDAKFEIFFRDIDHIEITQYVSLTPTTEKQIKYFIDVQRTSN